MESPTLIELLQNGVHFGHRTSKWHPRMKQFIFGSRNGVHIIDLEQTRERLIAAQEFLRDVVAKGGTVLYVGTKRQAKDIVRQFADSAGMPYVTERWLGGFFTNFGVVSKKMARLASLTRDRDTNGFAKYTKRERLEFEKEIADLEEQIGGVKAMEKLPEAVFVIDVKAEKTAIAEARRLKIPIVAAVDTNVDVEGITYPIPANDDATKAIEFLTKQVTLAVLEGKEQAVQRAEEKKAAAEEAAAAATIAMNEQLAAALATKEEEKT